MWRPRKAWQPHFLFSAPFRIRRPAFCRLPGVRLVVCCRFPLRSSRSLRRRCCRLGGTLRSFNYKSMHITGHDNIFQLPWLPRIRIDHCDAVPLQHFVAPLKLSLRGRALSQHVHDVAWIQANTNAICAANECDGQGHRGRHVNGWYATGQRRQFLPGGKLRRMGEHERRVERHHHKKCDETSNLELAKSGGETGETSCYSAKN